MTMPYSFPGAACSVPTHRQALQDRSCAPEVAARDGPATIHVGLAAVSAIVAEGMRAMTLISKSKPASQVTPTAVQFG